MENGDSYSSSCYSIDSEGERYTPPILSTPTRAECEGGREGTMVYPTDSFNSHKS